MTKAHSAAVKIDMPVEGAEPRRRRSRNTPFASLVKIASVIAWRRTAATLACLVFAGVAEGLGIASLLPLVTVLGKDTGGQKGISAQIVHAVESVGLEPSLGLFMTFLVISMCVKALLTIFALRRVGAAGAEVATKMRLDLIDSLLAARWSYYLRQPVGRFSAALSTEATQAGECYNNASKFIAEIIQVFVYALIATLFSWRLGLLSLGVGVLMVLTLNRFITITKQTARKQRKHIRAMVSGLTDLLVGIKPMKAMGRQARFQALFERDADKIGRAQRRQAFARDANKALQEPILAVCLAGGIYFAIGVAEMPTGQVLVMALLLARTVSSIGKAQQAWQSVRVSQSGFLAISESIDQAKAMREPRHAGARPTFEKGIEFRGVTFNFGDHEVITDASFEAPKGKVTTITGTSGAGKTTTVDLMLGLHVAGSGDILIDGAPIGTLDLITWRQMTGYVPQELILFHDTLRANVTLGQREFGEEDVRRSLEEAGATDFVAHLPEGLATVVGERGARLSGGQRQRIAIARALIHRPKVLILDEATTALDPQTEENIVRNVVALARDTGLTVIAISHQPAWARAADNVVHLAQGKIVQIERRSGDRDAPRAFHAADEREPAADERKPATDERERTADERERAADPLS